MGTMIGNRKNGINILSSFFILHLSVYEHLPSQIIIALSLGWNDGCYSSGLSAV